MAIRNNAPYNKTGIRLVPTLTTFYETQSYLQQVPNLNKFSLHVYLLALKLAFQELRQYKPYLVHLYVMIDRERTEQRIGES